MDIDHYHRRSHQAFWFARKYTELLGVIYIECCCVSGTCTGPVLAIGM
jgi:hypothetical protein